MQANPLTVNRILQGTNRFHDNSVIVMGLNRDIASLEITEDCHYQFTQFLKSCEPERVGTQFPDLGNLYKKSEEKLTVGMSIARTAIILQRWCGLPVSFSATLGRTNSGDDELIVIEHRIIPLAVSACALATRLLNGIFHSNPPQSLQDQLDNFVNSYFDGREKQIRYILAAEQSGIPWHPLTTEAEILVFGQGKYQRKIWKNFTSVTSHIATVVSSNKHVAAEVFRSHGIPVPRQVMISDEREITLALRRLKYPLVIKPATTDFGIAVYLDLNDETTVRSAFASARKHGKVLIEEQIAGEQHRIMVINGKFRSARRHKPAHVTGDGQTTITELVQQANVERLRNGWQPIPLDKESEFLVNRQGMRFDSIPDSGVEVRLRSQANLSTGGTMEIMTDSIHPENIELAERAAAVMDIDVAGIDYLTTDITQPYHKVGGAICEINVTPGLIFNEEELILSVLFPEHSNGCVPVILILDPDPDGRVTETVFDCTKLHTAPVCLANRQGLWRDGVRFVANNQATVDGAKAAVQEPGAAAAVIEVLPDEFCRNGLGLARCDILIINPPSNDGGALSAERRLAESRLRRISSFTLGRQQSDGRDSDGRDSDAVPPELSDLAQLASELVSLINSKHELRLTCTLEPNASSDATSSSG